MPDYDSSEYAKGVKGIRDASTRTFAQIDEDIAALHKLFDESDSAVARIVAPDEETPIPEGYWKDWRGFILPIGEVD